MAEPNLGIDSDVEEQFQRLTIDNTSTSSAPNLQLPQTYTVHYKKPGGGKGAGGAGSGLTSQERSVQEDHTRKARTIATHVMIQGCAEQPAVPMAKPKDSGLKPCYTRSPHDKWSKMLGFWVQD